MQKPSTGLCLILSPGFVPDLLCKVAKASDDMFLWIQKKKRNWEIEKKKKTGTRDKVICLSSQEGGVKVTIQDDMSTFLSSNILKTACCCC